MGPGFTQDLNPRKNEIIMLQLVVDCFLVDNHVETSCHYVTLELEIQWNLGIKATQGTSQNWSYY